MKYSTLRKRHRALKRLRSVRNRTAGASRFFQKVGRVLNFANPLRYIKKIDAYIIKKFIGTYIYSIALIISISIVFEHKRKLGKVQHQQRPAASHSL